MSIQKVACQTEKVPGLQPACQPLRVYTEGKSSVLLSIVSAHGPSCLQLDTQYSRSPVTGCLHSERLSEQMSAGTSKDMRIVCAKENHRAHFYLEQGIFGFLWVVWDWKLHCANWILNSYIHGGLKMAKKSVHRLLWSREVCSPLPWAWAGPVTCFGKRTWRKRHHGTFERWPREGLSAHVLTLPATSQPHPGWPQQGRGTKWRGSYAPDRSDTKTSCP